MSNVKKTHENVGHELNSFVVSTIEVISETYHTNLKTLAPRLRVNKETNVSRFCFFFNPLKLVEGRNSRRTHVKE